MSQYQLFQNMINNDPEITRDILLYRLNIANTLGWFEDEAEYNKTMALIDEAYPE